MSVVGIGLILFIFKQLSSDTTRFCSDVIGQNDLMNNFKKISQSDAYTNFLKNLYQSA